jgi:hypothetical protein
VNSTYFISVYVAGDIDTNADMVDMAFRLDTDSPADDWDAAQWHQHDGKLYARLLFGHPSVRRLDKGRWNVWLRVTVAGDAIVRRAGVVEVT